MRVHIYIVLPPMLSSEKIVENFENLSFCEGLKQSKRKLFSGLHKELKECIDKTYQCLEKIHVSLVKPDYTAALIDNSIVHRTEFQVECTSNLSLARVGSARLDLEIAMDAFNRGDVRMNNDKKSSALAFFEKYMDHGCVFYYKSGGMLSKDQIINFVYALVGVCVLEVRRDVADSLCDIILTSCRQ